MCALNEVKGMELKMKFSLSMNFSQGLDVSLVHLDP